MQAAESYMSLGNVSYPDTRMQYFDQAVKYLRMAEAIPGYNLSTHLSQYVNPSLCGPLLCLS